MNIRPVKFHHGPITRIQFEGGVEGGRERITVYINIQLQYIYKCKRERKVVSPSRDGRNRILRGTEDGGTITGRQRMNDVKK